MDMERLLALAVALRERTVENLLRRFFDARNQRFRPGEKRVQYCYQKGPVGGCVVPASKCIPRSRLWRAIRDSEYNSIGIILA